jgi:mono/diheme cytochrome c family protein
LSSTLVDDPDDDASEGRSRPLALALLLGLFKLAAAAMVVYLTYYFTTWFAHQPPPAAPLTDEQVSLAKKAEDLRASGKKLLSSYGWADPVTKSKVHIPIDRAMELLLAESTRPAAAPAGLVPGPAPAVQPARPGAGAAGATPASTAVVASPASPPAPTGMPPEQMYRLVCMACHDADGRGKIVKLAMPSIPDLTDPKFQASRTDAELAHSILEGKESTVNGVKIPLMLSMKDKLALAKTDVKDMVAFMRSFKGGKQVVSATPGGPMTGPTAELAQALAPTPAPLPAAPPSALLPSTTLAPTPSVANVAPKPTITTPAPASGTTINAAPTVLPGQPVPASPSASPLANVAALPPALPAAANTAAQAEKLRAAAVLYSGTCIPCHGPDGRGTLVRVAMPPIPDFTSRDWQSSRSSSQLASSILEGRGTLMPPWNTKLTPDQARSLVLYVRNFGGPEILAAETEGAAPSSGPALAEFDNKLRSLRQQFDEVEKQLQTLPQAPAR